MVRGFAGFFLFYRTICSVFWMLVGFPRLSSWVGRAVVSVRVPLRGAAHGWVAGCDLEVAVMQPTYVAIEYVSRKASQLSSTSS